MNIARTSILILGLSLQLSICAAQSADFQATVLRQKQPVALASPFDTDAFAGPKLTTTKPSTLVNTITVLNRDQLPESIGDYLAKGHEEPEEFFAQLIWEGEEFVYLLGLLDKTGFHILTFDPTGLLLSRETEPLKHN